jgi:acyl-CoA reductase-like NAD-dependent aldehyde dehydrogenase
MSFTPTNASPIAPTPRAELDRAVADLQEAKGRFAVLGIPERLELLSRILELSRSVAPRWVEAALRAKGLDADSPQAGEEWLGGPMTVHRNLRLLKETLSQIQTHGSPQLPDGAVSTRPDGQVVVRVFPASLYDKLLFAGFTAEVWMEPSVSAETLPQTMAAVYQGGPPAGPGKVCAVMGAGNVASIGPMDVLYKMFTENGVCILKMNPVNEYLGPFIQESFAPAIEAGYLRVVYGGADVGSHLVYHEGVDDVHITGSDRTHDAIVWGPAGPERERRKAEDRPLLQKPITSELGNVSPIIVVPGPWRESDLVFQAENLATMLANNAGFNCNAAKLIVQHAGWSRRDALLSSLERALWRVPQRCAYYPGAQERYESFVKAHPDVREIGQRTDEKLPWTIIPGVDPAHEGSPVFRAEAFCSLVAETRLAAEDAAGFLRRAVDFCNEKVWGSLNVTLLVHPETERELGAELDRAIAALRYGTISVNHWAALGYGLVVTPWGAFPGHELSDIQSGRGFVHNTMMFERPQKSVVRGPFRVKPRPPWFVTSKKTHKIAPRLADFEAEPSPAKLPGIFVNALQS